jgi:uncharacterized protein with FMN-binding domain
MKTLHHTPVRSLIYTTLLVTVTLILSDCKTAPIMGSPVQMGKIADGVYEGSYSSWPNSATVSVTVKDGRGR